MLHLVFPAVSVKRGERLPVEPVNDLKSSKRAFDGLIRVWKKAIRQWEEAHK